MGRYIEWNMVAGKYPLIDTIDGDSEISSVYLQKAEYELDAILGTHFTVPFSSNNETVKDLAIDLTYIKAAMGKDDRVSQISSDFYHRINMLKMGEMLMSTTSSGLLSSDVGQAVYSRDMDAEPIFNIDNPTNWGVDSGYAAEITDAR